MRIHIVGLGGAGMSAIAEILLGTGHIVTGSDLVPSTQLSRLIDKGVVAHIGHASGQLGEAEIVAVSSAIPKNNPEVLEARQSGVPVLSRAEILTAISETKRTVSVAGTHGKTTTSAMLTVALRGSGFDPSFIVGGDLLGLAVGASVGGGDILVVEADESDGTFLELDSAAVIVTNVEPDHLDFYGGFAQLEDAFSSFVAKAKGPKVVCLDDPGSAKLAAGSAGVTTYGVAEQSDWRIQDPVPTPSGVGFKVVGPQGMVTINLAQPGMHNVRNATAALAMAVALGAELDSAADSLSSFGGVGRRFEERGRVSGIRLIDDYAHLPTEVSAALAAGKSLGPKRLLAVFQPHRFSRTEQLWATFHDSFTDAAVLIVTGIYASGEKPRPGISGKLIADDVAEKHPELDVRYIEDLGDVEEFLVDELRSGDLCLTLGAGDLTELPDTLLLRLQQRYGQTAAEASGGTGSDQSGVKDLVGSRDMGTRERARWSEATEVALERLGELAQRDVSTAPLSTYRVGGIAAGLVAVSSVATLEAISDALAGLKCKTLVVGRGSNLLVSDAGFDGIVVQLDDSFSEVSIGTGSGLVSVIAGGAALLPVVARQSVKAGLTGFEWAVGVPGSIGGAVRMNAGGHGSDMASCLVRVSVFDLFEGGPYGLNLGELDLGYRSSAIEDGQVVLFCELALERIEEQDDGSEVTSRERITQIVRWRRQHQPGGRNAGSVFANPPENSAGLLIEQAGLKGFRIGTAQVSSKHANFIQADDGGSADDIYALIRHIQNVVVENVGIELRPENRLIGFEQERGR